MKKSAVFPHAHLWFRQFEEKTLHLFSKNSISKKQLTKKSYKYIIILFFIKNLYPPQNKESLHNFLFIGDRPSIMFLTNV